MVVEVSNAIRRRAARNLLGQAESERLLERFLNFSVSLLNPIGLHQEAMRIAGRYNRPTVYDAYCVALAQIAGCDLWTADQRLLNSLMGQLPFVKTLSEYGQTSGH